MIHLIGRNILFLRNKISILSNMVNQTAYWMVVGVFKKKGIRYSLIIDQIVKSGVGAVPIVFLISLVMGLILALQAAVQLERVGALSFVATLVSVSVTRELGPLITAVIVAGRSGSAFTAEIASMKVAEELDALKAMGIPPVKLLISPKVLAMLMTMPGLTLLADFISITGGFTVGVWGLGISYDSYMNQTLSYLTIGDVLGGVIKSAFFALIIAIVGCFQGISVTGGAEGVGRRTTASVVISIFLIIVADGFFTLLTYWFV